MTPAQAHRRELYHLGYRHGRRIAQTDTAENHHRRLWLEVQLAGNTAHRAFALGELRGYREATR